MFEINYQDLKNLKQYTVAVLPDFFLDVIITPNIDFQSYIELLKHTYDRNGGNILGSNVNFFSGGNAGNVVQVTNALGINTYFIGETSLFGKQLIEFFFEKKGVHCFFGNTGEMATSVILEFNTEKGRNNIMSSYSGSVKNFGPASLTEVHWRILNTVNFISITNFQNQLFLELTEEILKNVSTQTILLVDFSDLTPHKHRSKDIYNFFSKKLRLPDCILANENEMVSLYEYIFTHINNTSNYLQINKESNIFDVATSSARVLSQYVPEVYFCLHTATFVSIFKNSKCLATIITNTIDDIKRATGSGDAWHAGFIAGLITQSIICKQDLLKANWDRVLQFSNLVAAYWMTHTFLEPIDQILTWGKEKHLISIRI